MCRAWAHLHLRYFQYGWVSAGFSHWLKYIWKTQFTYSKKVFILVSVFVSLSVWKTVWSSVRPSSRREASASPATTRSTCSVSCRRHARSLTCSSTSGKTTTRSNLSGRRPTFTRNRATQRIAFGESPRRCLLWETETLLYFMILVASVHCNGTFITEKNE